MMETCGQLMNFLNQAGMIKSLKAFQDDMEIFLRNQQSQKNDGNSQNNEKSSNSNLLKIIKKAIHQNNKQDAIPQFNNYGQQNQNLGQQKNQKLFVSRIEVKQNMSIILQQYKLQSQEETEQIMEKLMNKLVASPGLLEDEKLNSKIEKFFDNQTFQKMVEATDVMQDISNLSFTNSFLQKNKQETQSIIKTQNTNYWEDDNPSNIGSGIEILYNQYNLKYENIGKQQQMNPHQNQQFQNQEFKIDQFQQSNPPNQIQESAMNQLDQINNKAVQKQDNQGVDTKVNNKPQQVQPQPDSSKNQDKDAKEQQQRNEIKQDVQNQQIKSEYIPSDAFINPVEDFQPTIDEYTDDDDPGFDLYEVPQRDFQRVAQQLAEKYEFPSRAQAPVPKKEGYDAHKEYQNTNIQNPVLEDNRQSGSIFLPQNIKHPPSKDQFYPVQYDKVIYDAFNLKVIFDRERTGFEETKDFPIVINSIVAGRYQVMEYLGSAAFSKAIQCKDLVTDKVMCMKVIENNKDYFDQSIDEIKLLRYINYNGDVDEKNVLKYYDYFYHKEHLFIVTELLEDNLYEFYKFNRENEPQKYFTVGRLQKVTQQILVALDYIHSLRLIHCDLKPENILMKSKPRGEVKVIDFGSSCFIHDHLSSYVQSRSYRAPEVIIGCKYDYRIDIWSLGCILAELWTGNVLFQNDHIQGLLARVIGIIGPFPEWMMKEGRLIQNFFTREKLLYMDFKNLNSHLKNQVPEEGDQSQATGENKKTQILVPKHSNLKTRLRVEDSLFIDFIRQCLQIDYTRRPTAKEALTHPWFRVKYPDGL